MPHLSDQRWEQTATGLVAPERPYIWVTGVGASALGYSDVDARYLAGSPRRRQPARVGSHGVIRRPKYARGIESGFMGASATVRAARTSRGRR
jgi:hypothetical protein